MFSYETLVNEINSSGSDKEKDHGYCTAYFDLFSKMDIDNVSNFLEIGITNTISDNSSLHAWGRLFPKAKIYGIDIAEYKIFNKGNIVSFEADQSSILDLSRFMEFANYPKFDIILDDGSHIFNHALTSFEYFFKYVKNGGLYMIEDVSKRSGEFWQQRVEEWEEYFSLNKSLKYEIIDTKPENPGDDSIVIGIWKKN